MTNYLLLFLLLKLNTILCYYWPSLNRGIQKGDVERRIPVDGNIIDVVTDLLTSKEIDPGSASSDKWCSCPHGALTKQHYTDCIRKGFNDLEILQEIG